MDINKIIARAKSILLTPRSEWPVAEAEPATVGSVYGNYIFVMAAVPAIARFVSLSLIGVSAGFLGSYRIGIGAGLTGAVLSYVWSLLGVFIMALVVDALAPSFGGQKNRVQAVKVVAYSFTASWVASVIAIIPGLGLLAALAGLIYSIYLLNMGLPVMMKCPPEKSAGYTAVSVIVGLVIFIVIGAVTAGLGVRGGMMGFPGRTSITESSSSFDKGTVGSNLTSWASKMEQASRQMEAAQKSGDKTAQANAVGQMVGAALGGGGKVESLAPDRIKPFVPETLAGLPRTSVSAERNGAMGLQVSKARARYSDGAQHSLDLEITDTGSLKGVMGFAAGWAGVEQDTETDSGYDKTYKSGGNLVHEKWDNRNRSGEYAVVVGDRFAVQVSGSASSIDDLKSAVASVNLSGLEALKDEGVKSN
ncbi:MAG TPA: Yip1 family protein [Steroidobacteraceae bacterium]|nr:Yip1 family protein [Steroidobacteraceae bacterium]